MTIWNCRTYIRRHLFSTRCTIITAGVKSLGPHEMMRNQRTILDI